jgi:hypothetical protein
MGQSNTPTFLSEFLALSEFWLASYKGLFFQPFNSIFTYYFGHYGVIKKSPKAKKARDLHKAPNYCPPGRVTRLERTYARRRKQDVLLFLVHYRIPLKKTSLNNYRAPNRVLAGLPEVEEKGYRRLTIEEAAEYFNITNPSSVGTWWATRAIIFGKVNFTKNYPLKWPALEKELIKQFQAARASNKIVIIHWFRRISQQIWQRLYPNAPNVFVFSNGWF